MKIANKRTRLLSGEARRLTQDRGLSGARRAADLVSGSVRGVERRGESGLGEPERLMRLWDNMELVLDKKVSQGASYTRHQGPKLTGSPTQAETAVNGPLAVCGGEVPAATRSSFRKQGEYLDQST